MLNKTQKSSNTYAVLSTEQNENHLHKSNKAGDCKPDYIIVKYTFILLHKYCRETLNSHPLAPHLYWLLFFYPRYHMISRDFKN